MPQQLDSSRQSELSKANSSMAMSNPLNDFGDFDDDENLQEASDDQIGKLPNRSSKNLNAQKAKKPLSPAPTKEKAPNRVSDFGMSNQYSNQDSAGISAQGNNNQIQFIINLEPNQSKATTKAYKSAMAVSTSQDSGEVKLGYFRFKLDKSTA